MSRPHRSRRILWSFSSRSSEGSQAKVQRSFTSRTAWARFARSPTVSPSSATGAYMPAVRLAEGLMRDLNVRENTELTALDRLTVGPIVSRRREVFAVERELSELAVKAPSLQAPVSALSGGNQQKVVMARAMLSDPAILVADEPTQGVDVGARAEIYRILREVTSRGVPVVVASSDALELEGLCDRVIVMSRGHVVATLEGEEVTEERIIHAAISATTHAAQQAARRATGSSRFARFIEGDYAPVFVLA